MKILIVLFLWLNVIYAVDATMEIVKNNSSKSQIVIFKSQQSANDHFSSKIIDLLKKDLEVSCNFSISESPHSVAIESFPSDAANRGNLALVANVITLGEKVALQIKLYDTGSQKLVLDSTISPTTHSKYPFLSHKAAILINDYLGAHSIDWMNKFVVFSRYLNAKQSEIIVADYTLTFQTTVIKGGLNLFPKWSDNTQQAFYYTSYVGAIPTIKKFNLSTATTENIASSEGMIVCSDVSTDGKKLVMTMAPASQPDIFVFDVATKQKTKITNYSGIDVGGKFIQNDSKIAFISDRLSKPSIFVQSLNGSNFEKLANIGSNSSSFSTYQNYVAYSSKESSDRNFNIYLVSTIGGFKQQITTSGKNEFPRFAPNGQSLLYLKESGGKSNVAIFRLNDNKEFLFPSKIGALQSIDW